MSSARGTVSPFLIMEAMKEANRFAETSPTRIIQFSLGQPGKEAPLAVRNAVAERLKSAPLGYTEAGGLPALRVRIAQYYMEKYSIDVAPERIFVTLGSSCAVIMAFLCAFDAGDDIAITLPCYSAYPNIMQSVNITPVLLRGEENHKFQPHVGLLKALPKAPKGLVIANPSNPTGAILEPETLASLVSYCDTHHIQMISDEIYQGITYGKKAETILKYTDQAIVINSFSKYFCLPGWRVGWAVVPPDMAKAYDALASSLFISPSSVGQYAALETFNHLAELDGVVEEYAENRRAFLQALPEMGITTFAPVEGGFFIYTNISHLTNDSLAFCKKMLHETGVVSVSGVDFDREQGHNYIRFSFSGAKADIIEGLARLKHWLKH